MSEQVLETALSMNCIQTASQSLYTRHDTIFA